MDLSIVIPAYNEAKRLPANLDEIVKIAKDFNNYEIIIVNDGSTDETGQIVRKYSQANQHIKLVDQPQNKGKGASLRGGVEKALYEYILTIDADGSTPFGEYSKLIDTLQNGSGDIAIGSRRVPDAHIVVPQPWYRILIGKLANQLIQFVLLPGIKDTQCGFKLYKGNIAHEIFPLTSIDKFGIDMELLAIARNKGYKIVEVPVTWRHTPDSTLRPIKSTLRTLYDFLRIYLIHRVDE